MSLAAMYLPTLVLPPVLAALKNAVIISGLYQICRVVWAILWDLYLAGRQDEPIPLAPLAPLALWGLFGWALYLLRQNGDRLDQYVIDILIAGWVAQNHASEAGNEDKENAPPADSARVAPAQEPGASAARNGSAQGRRQPLQELVEDPNHPGQFVYAGQVTARPALWERTPPTSPPSDVKRRRID
ncbi:hypothetical protein B0T17DRAFT_655836 [Bombardia bombarda]|uniref:Uncharacterized protein n=1 Tax=Bombardia bombarda TaxID=252184 RepID=A0AA39WUL7_9PEZI|nr:hypothetical protein B0T17DRAFT_655836 [Bombardia bombarda]